MKKIVIGLIVLSLSVNIVYASATTNFFENLVKMSKGKVDNITKNIAVTTKNLKRVVNKNIDAPKLIPSIQKDASKVLLANKAQKIIDKGTFEKEFFDNQNFNNQLSMIVQSSKYGDEYFVVAKKVSHISPDILKNNLHLKRYLPKKKINKQTLQSKYIDTLNKTGKYGWERLKNMGTFIKNHPKFSTLGGAYAWFLLDPNGFEEAAKNAAKSAGIAVAVAGGAVVSGMGEVVIEKTNEVIDEIKKDMTSSIDISNSYILKMLSGLLVLVSIFMIWRKRKVIKHFILKADEVKVKKEDIKHTKSEKEDDEF